ncbi:MAG: ester cyclase [Candidatus Promineifilaceae bacterium]|nr:ester cyclase [Candidatus Promineifilaceae bacterium]
MLTKEEEYTAVVERVWQEIVVDADLDRIDELMASEYVYRGPAGLELHGPEGFQHLIAAVHDLLTDIDLTVHEYITQGNRVLSRWSGQAREKQSGRAVEWHGATISHVVDGKIVDDWEYWDRLQLAEQLADNWLQRLLVGAVARQVSEALPYDG